MSTQAEETIDDAEESGSNEDMLKPDCEIGTEIYHENEIESNIENETKEAKLINVFTTTQKVVSVFMSHHMLMICLYYQTIFY